MDERTREALDASIQHWLEHSVRKDPPNSADTGSTGCALCTLFVQDDCTGCPIRDKEWMGDWWDGCDGSPWQEADYDARSWRASVSRGTVDYLAAQRFRTSARKMHDYLVELRDA